MTKQSDFEIPVRVHKKSLRACASRIGASNAKPLGEHAIDTLRYTGFVGLGGDAGYSDGVFTGHHHFVACIPGTHTMTNFDDLPGMQPESESEEVD